MYLKRNSIPKFWPIPRKGTKYLAVASHNKNQAIPLLIVLRDIFKIVENKKEAKKIINEKLIKINGREIKNINFPISLFDIVSLVKSSKSYRAVLSENKKIVFEEVSGKDSEMKIYKVINKKILDGKTIQLNLMHGKNIISKDKVKTGDSVVLDFKENKIIRTIPLEKGREAFITDGKHAGQKGKIEDIITRGGKSLAKISSKKGRINVWIKNIIVVE